MDKKRTYFEVSDGAGTISKNSTNSFDTAQEAIDMAIEFKNDPRTHNANMSDENVAYWKARNYTVVKKTITTEEIVTI